MVAEAGFFCAETVTSVRAFQQARGLADDGICGEYTWAGLVEASWRLGDRILLLAAPNLRGDDVAALQGDLGRLGFDCGKVDGIFGDRTANAILDFQRNCGLVVDGLCGPVTLQAIERVGRQSGTGPGVATVRERDRLHSPTASLRELRVVIGQFGGLSNLTRALTRALRTSGAIVITVDEPDARVQAEAANSFDADVYLGFQAAGEGIASSPSARQPAPLYSVSFYSVPTFESAGGRALAERIVAGLEAPTGSSTPGTCSLVQGMRLQVLRETRMPAVLVTITDVRHAVDRSFDVAGVVRDALEGWASQPSVH